MLNWICGRIVKVFPNVFDSVAVDICRSVTNMLKPHCKDISSAVVRLCVLTYRAKHEVVWNEG